MTRKFALFLTVIGALALVGGPAIATGGGANPDHTTVIDGATRYHTAAEIALTTGPAKTYAQTLYIANGENLVDAVVVGATSEDHRKILLVERDEIPAPTREALQQISHAELVFLGGDDAISPEVRDEVMSLTDNHAYPN